MFSCIQATARQLDGKLIAFIQWAHIEQTSKSSIQEKKIRVLFLAADDATSTPAKTNGASRESLHPSSSPEAVTPQRDGTVSTGAVPRPQDRPAENKNLGEIKSEAHNPAATGVQSTVAAAAATVTKALPSQGDLQSQLEEAKQKIARLTQQISESSGLRQRKGESTRDSKAQLSTAVDTRQAPAGGVPIHITALLCLISFLIAYFLF